MYMQRTTRGAAGNGLYTTIKYMRCASGIDMGTTIKHLRRTTSGVTGNGLGAAMKYLRRKTSAAANNGLSTTIIPPCSEASFEVNSEPHTGARPSVRLCVGPELSRCVQDNSGQSSRYDAARLERRSEQSRPDRPSLTKITTKAFVQTVVCRAIFCLQANPSSYSAKIFLFVVEPWGPWLHNL
jgi:hypothetical protein